MSTRTLGFPVLSMPATSVPAHRETTIGSILRDVAMGWRAARVDHAALDAFAELDAATLRDIGLGEDEIPRAHAGEAFTPRAWQR